MAKGLSRIALIVATIAVVMLISSCSDVTESSQSSNKEKSVTSLVGEIYHGDGYFILDENGLQIVKEGAAYDENKKLWNAPFAAVRKINDTFYCDSFTSPDKFDDNMNYKGEVPQDSKKMIKLLKSGDVTESGLTVTSAVSSVKETLEYNRETNSTEPGISQTVYTEITLSGEVTLEGVLYVVLDEDLYISEENSILFFPYPESLKNALGFSPRFSGDIESSYLTSNASKTSVLLYGDCVYFYAGNTDNSEWLTKDFRNKPFGTAKLTVSDIKLIWKSDSLDRFSFTVKNAENVQAKK